MPSGVVNKRITDGYYILLAYCITGDEYCVVMVVVVVVGLELP